MLALVLGLALLAGGAYSAAYLAAGDKVPVGTTIAGVDIGGHDPAAAATVLRDGLAARAGTPFTVVINGRTQQVAPSQVGLGIDYAASVRKAGAERSWRPSRLWSYFTAGDTFDPVVTLDQDRLATLLRRLDVSDGQTAADGSVVFRHHTFTVRAPRPGLTLDPRVAGTAFWNAYLSDDPSVQLRLSPTAPTIDTSALHRFVNHFANPAMSAPVELHFGRATLHLPPSSYGDLLAARRVGNRLAPMVRARALSHVAEAGLVGAPVDRPKPATVALVHGRPQIVDARPGMTFRPHDVATALMRAITAPDRTARVRPTIARPSFTNADARRLGIRTRLSTYSVSLPHTSHGVRVADVVSQLDGVVLHPGDTLSLRGVLGARTPSGARGDAVATAVFNAAWLGGLRVTSHVTRASYTGATPVGRDASLRDGQDVAFRDDTRYGVLVAASVHQGSLTVSLWSTPHWTVTSAHGSPTHVVRAARHVVRAQQCEPRKGRNGFDVTVTRSFARGGEVDHQSSYTVTYAPVAAVVCRTKHHRHHH